MIRLMKIEEQETVLALWYQMNQKDHDFISMDYWLSLREVMETTLGNANVYVYELDQEIKGFTFIVEGFYIGGLYIEDNERRKDYATELVEYLKTRYDELVIDIYEKNTGAKAFLETVGFALEEKVLEDETQEYELTYAWYSEIA